MAWSPVGRRFETRVASPSTAPGSYDHLLAVFGEVGEGLARLRIFYYGSQRNRHEAVLSTPAYFVTTLAVGSPLSLIVLSIGEIQEGVKVSGGPKYYIAPFAPVSPVGPSPGDGPLAPKADAAPSTIAAFCVDFSFVDKHRLRRVPRACGG